MFNRLPRKAALDCSTAALGCGTHRYGTNDAGPVRLAVVRSRELSDAHHLARDFIGRELRAQRASKLLVRRQLLVGHHYRHRHLAQAGVPGTGDQAVEDAR